VLVASLVAGALGYLWLRWVPPWCRVGKVGRACVSPGR
jgi:hypothetical protein